MINSVTTLKELKNQLGARRSYQWIDPPTRLRLHVRKAPAKPTVTADDADDCGSTSGPRRQGCREKHAPLIFHQAPVNLISSGAVHCILGDRGVALYPAFHNHSWTTLEFVQVRRDEGNPFCHPLRYKGAVL